MDEVIIHTHRARFHWHDATVATIEWDLDPDDLPVIRLGSEVLCGIGAKALQRKMGAPTDFKGQRGLVVIVHLETTPEALPNAIELGVMLDRVGVVWFTPAELELAQDIQEISHAS